MSPRNPFVSIQAPYITPIHPVATTQAPLNSTAYPSLGFGVLGFRVESDSQQALIYRSQFRILNSY